MLYILENIFIVGDPSRPFPTEPEFRASALAAPRTNPPVVPPAFSLLRQQHAAAVRFFYPFCFLRAFTLFFIDADD